MAQAGERLVRAFRSTFPRRASLLSRLGWGAPEARRNGRGASCRIFGLTPSTVPRDSYQLPAGQKAQAGSFLGDPIGRKGAQVWMSVVGKPALEIDGVINLMLLDEQKAIQRDLADAAATVH